MKKEIYKFLDKKDYIPVMAQEIVETFQTGADQENIDYSFTINRKTGEVSNQEANTYFLFDTNGQTVLHDFKKALFHEDLSHIEEGSGEEQELMEDVKNFLLKVCKNITTNYYENLKETVRRVILGNKVDAELAPLETIEVVSIDLADYSSIPESSKYLLKIGKKPETDINTDEVIQFVQNRQEKTGMDIDTILSIEHKADNPMFKNVVSIEPGRKFLNEISIYFFVDYSLRDGKIEEIE